MKRKGDSYIGGHTVITLHPRTVEQGLIEQTREVKQQRQKDQEKFDASRVDLERQADGLARKNSPGRLRHKDDVQKYYEKQIHQIDVLLKGKPIYSAKLLIKQLELLQKLLDTVRSPQRRRRRIERRMKLQEQSLARLGDRR